MGRLVRMVGDVRHALRGLARTPGLTAVAVLTLAIGIAAITTVFSWVDAVFLEPLRGVPDHASLRLVSGRSRDGEQRSFSIPNFRDLQKASQNGDVPFEMASFALATVNLMEGDRPERLWASLVSANFFEVLRVPPAAGRTFTPEEGDAPHPVAVLSHRLWQRRFHGDPGLVGRAIRLNGAPYTVVGVAAPDFYGADIGLSADLWIPVAMEQRILGGESRWDQRGRSWMEAIARLRPGVTDEQAGAALAAVSARLAQTWPENNAGVTHHLDRFWNAPGSREPRLALTVAGAMAVLVLVLACANVANLLLVRALGRRREAAIRLALGAGRDSLIQLLLAEGLVLAVLAGGAGLLASVWSRRLFLALAPNSDRPPSPPPSLDLRILGFTAAVSLLTGVLFSLAPALQMASPHLAAVLRDEGTAVSGGRKSRLRSGLVVVQVALSCVLLISAGLFTRSLREAARLDPGFSARRVLLASLDVFPNGYDEARGRTFYRELLRRVAALPGVESATVAMLLPLSGSFSSTSVEIAGYVPKPEEEISVGDNIVGPQYFETMGIAILRGRGITFQDDERAPAVAVINETMAHRYWTQGNALGRTIRWRNRDLTVVGIVRNGDYRRLREEPLPYMYLPLLQSYLSRTILHVRTAGDPAELAGAVRAEVRQLDPALPLSGVQTLETHLRLATFAPRLLATFLGGLGMIALLLSTVGLYSVIRYAVSQRTRELGVRLALGARPAEVVRLVLGQGLLLALVGAGLGLAAACVTGRLLASQLYGVSTTDPAVFLAVVTLLGAVSALASWLPARRAAAVDPMVALRSE
jgi:predicted permease